MEVEAKPLAGCVVVFDLDGTLVDTAPDLVAALNHALETHGLAAVDLEEVRGLIGRGAKAMIREGLTRRAFHGDVEDEAERLWPRFLDHYRAHIAKGSQPYPGVRETLDRLRALGARLAVCTNKTQALSEALLEALDLAEVFDGIVGADSVPAKKPDPGHLFEAVERAGGGRYVCLVGDSETDAATARAAACDFFFWPEGYGPEPQNGVPKDAVLEAYSELVERVCARQTASGV